jgi:hypothetical protein
MLRRAKRSKIEIVAPKEEEEVYTSFQHTITFKIFDTRISLVILNLNILKIRVLLFVSKWRLASINFLLYDYLYCSNIPRGTEVYTDVVSTRIIRRIYMFLGKGKRGKVHPRTGHEGREAE